MANVKLAKKLPARAAVVVRPLCSGDLGSSEVSKALLKRLDFTGAAGSSVTVTGESPAITVLVGAGTTEDFDLAAMRGALASALRSLRTHKSVTIDLGPLVAATTGLLAESDAGAEADELVQMVTEAAILGLYSFDIYKSEEQPEATSTVTIVSPDGGKAGLAAGQAIADAVCMARDFVNEPGGTLTAPVFADRIKLAGTEAGLKVEVLGLKQIEKLGLGGLLAVNKGSLHPPRFVKLTYKPKNPVASVALVGKGITFDSGGLSIKPGDGMMTMKMDMGGAAAVLATVTALPALDIAVEVTAYAAMTDNMLGPDATRPGDVFTARNGKTVEVLNTDAEGRLVLADALSLASEANHDVIIDVATLTGAAMVALGPDIAAVLSNDDLLSDDLLAAADRSGEGFWPLPLPKQYRKMIDSPVADMKNIGGRMGGTITAGLFLQEFVDPDTSWAHLDIAGPAFVEAEAGENTKGGTGFAVRTLIEWLRTLATDVGAIAE